MKGLESLQKADACLEPKHASMIKFFVNILNDYFRNKSFITDVRLGYI